MTFIVTNMFTGMPFFSSGVLEGGMFFYLMGEPAFFTHGISSALQVLTENKESWEAMYRVLLSIHVGFMILLTVLNWPGKAKAEYRREADEPGTRGVLFFRVLTFCGILMIPFVIYICQVVFEDQIRALQVEGDITREILERLIDYDYGPK